MSAAVSGILRLASNDFFEVVRWWREQLGACARWLWSYLLTQWRSSTVIVFEAAGGSVHSSQRRGLNRLFDFALDSAGRWPSDLPQRISKEGVSRAQYTVGVSGDLVFKLLITFPDTAERQLASAIALHLEREFPVEPSKITWYFSVRNRLRDARRIEVEVLILRLTDLQRIEQAVEAWGIKATRFGPFRDGKILGEFCRQNNYKAEQFGSVHRAFLYSGLLLAIIAIGCVAGQWIYERRMIGPLQRSATEKAKSIQQTYRVVQNSLKPVHALASIAGRSDAADLVYLLTDRTPADTWIYQLKADMRAAEAGHDNNESPAVIITAITPSSLSYLKAVSSMPGFDGVEMVSADPSPGNTSSKVLRIKVHSVR